MKEYEDASLQVFVSHSLLVFLFMWFLILLFLDMVFYHYDKNNLKMCL